MRKHPAYSADIIRPLFGDELTAGVRHHHERYDGSGYPDGLAGDDIPLIARAMCVVDSYDAMSFRRPYRQALTYTACREELARCAGSQFDPDMVAAFERVLERLRELKATAVAVAGEAARRVDREAHATLRQPRGRGLRGVPRTWSRPCAPCATSTRRRATSRRSPARDRRPMLVADAEEDPALHSHIGDETFSDEEILRVFAGEPVDRTVLFVDQFGVWISGVSPIQDQRGEVVAVANADLPATTGADRGRRPAQRRHPDVRRDGRRRGRATRARRARGDHRRPHRPVQPPLPSRAPRRGDRALRPITAAHSLCCSSTWTTSGPSTTATATAQGTAPCASVAHIIETSLRQVDLAARFGGEEFADHPHRRR